MEELQAKRAIELLRAAAVQLTESMQLEGSLESKNHLEEHALTSSLVARAGLLVKIEELLTEIGPKKKKPHKPFDVTVEVPRIGDNALREGVPLSRFLKRVYLKAALDRKKKYGKNADYRYSYLESAFSARHVERNPKVSQAG